MPRLEVFRLQSILGTTGIANNCIFLFQSCTNFDMALRAQESQEELDSGWQSLSPVNKTVISAAHVNNLCAIQLISKFYDRQTLTIIIPSISYRMMKPMQACVCDKPICCSYKTDVIKLLLPLQD